MFGRFKRGRTAKAGDARGRAVEMGRGDVVLVSYPKSGNTWARFFWANLLFPDRAPVHFKNVVECVPEVHEGDRVVPRADGGPVTVFKSHARYVPDYPKVIYLLRDGRDVYVSYYHYLRHRIPEGTSFAAFLENDGLYPWHWHEHVTSWLVDHRPKELLVVRYEDLKADPRAGFRRMVDFAGLEVTDAALERAVAQSDFKAMAQAEERHGRPFRNPDEAAVAGPFMRKGVVGDWQSEFGDVEKAVFKRYNGDMLVQMGYADGADW